MKNKTCCKSFDRLEKDTRVTQVYKEDSDGYVIELAEGYHFEECISIRGQTVKDVLEQLHRVDSK